MSVGHGIVQGEVSQVASVYVLLFWNFRGHYYSRRIDSIRNSLSLQILKSIDWVFQNPQHRIRHRLQNVHPHLERHRVQLVHLVEVSKDKLIFGQIIFLARRPEAPWLQSLPASLRIVIQKVAVRHVNWFLGVVVLHYLRGRRQLIRHNVVNIVGARRAAESHKLYLDLAWTQREDVCTVPLGPPVQIEKYVNIL